MSAAKIGLQKRDKNPIFGKRGEKHPRFGEARAEGAGKPSQKKSNDLIF